MFVIYQWIIFLWICELNISLEEIYGIFLLCYSLWWYGVCWKHFEYEGMLLPCRHWYDWGVHAKKYAWQSLETTRTGTMVPDSRQLQYRACVPSICTYRVLQSTLNGVRNFSLSLSSFSGRLAKITGQFLQTQGETYLWCIWLSRARACLRTKA